jgi:hypothetical protein
MGIMNASCLETRIRSILSLGILVPFSTVVQKVKKELSLDINRFGHTLCNKRRSL